MAGSRTHRLTDLGLPNEERFLGAGLYYGASEAPLTKDEHVFIVGGGNSAGQAAMHFAPVARRVTDEELVERFGGRSASADEAPE